MTARREGVARGAVQPRIVCPAGGVDGIPAAILEQQEGEIQGVKVVGTFVAPDTDAGRLYERNQLCKTFAGRFKVLDEVDQLRDTDKDPDVSQLFYKLLRSRNQRHPVLTIGCGLTHLPDVIVPVFNTVVLPRLRTSFEILARANGTPTEELDRAWEEVQLSVAKGGSNIGGHADVADASVLRRRLPRRLAITT